MSTPTGTMATRTAPVAAAGTDMAWLTRVQSHSMAPTGASGRASATSARQRRDDERTMERDRFTIRPRRTGAAPAAVPFHGSNSFRLPTDVTGAPERFRWPT